MKQVDLSMNDILLYVEAFSSCAIEGNKLGIYMSELWKKDQGKFIKELLEMLNNDNLFRIKGE